MNWQQPLNDGCSPITEYRIAYKINDCCSTCGNNGFNNQVSGFNNFNDYTPLSTSLGNSVGIVNTYAVVSSLGNVGRIQEGVSYSFIVMARNKYGWGPYSESVTVVALTPPSAPLSPSVAAQSSDLLQLTWTRPNDRWNYVTGYKVHVWTSNNRENVGNCLFSNPLDTKCILLLDDLRASPFNIATGNTINMKIFAMSL